MRRFTRLSLRSLFVLVTLCCVAALWVSVEMRRYRVQSEVVQRMLARMPDYYWVRTVVPRPRWAWKLLVGQAAGEIEIAVFNYKDTPGKRSIGILPEEIKQVASWRRSKKLHLGGEAVNDELLRPFSGMQQLEEVMLVDANVTSAGIAVLRDLPRLKYLRFDYDHRLPGGTEKKLIYADAIEAMARFPKLEKLVFHDYKLDHSAVKALPELKNLSYLILVNAGLTDEDMAVLAQMPQIELLHLADNSGITDASVDLLPKIRNLKELSLGGTGLTVDGLEHLLDLLPHFDPDDPGVEELMVTPAVLWEFMGREGR